MRSKSGSKYTKSALSLDGRNFLNMLTKLWRLKVSSIVSIR